MSYEIKRPIFWSLRYLGHGRAILGSPDKDKCFGNWSLIYLLLIKPAAEKPGERHPTTTTTLIVSQGR